MGLRENELRARLRATFEREAEEHLGTIGVQLAALEGGLPAGPAAEAVEEAFRAMHTLKGAARSVGLEDVERVCHGLESVLSVIKKDGRPPEPERVGRLQGVCSGLAALVEGRPAPAVAELLRLLEADGGQAPVLAPLPAHARPAPSSTVRLDVERLDALQAKVEELTIAKLAADERMREAALLVAAPGPDQAAAARRLHRHLVHDRRVLHAAVEALQESLLPMRLVPASSVLEPLPPMVAEMARARGKEIDFVAQGQDLRVDRKVLQAVKDPLLHLVRNAVDHGLEPAEERLRRGKARRGRLRVSFRPQEERAIELRVEDDGAGIDEAALRAAAVRGHHLSPESAEALSSSEARALAFVSGLSTSPVVSDLSGHGLGMAIVRDRVEQLGGRVALDTAAGNGTTVRIVLPASIATFRGLLVRAGDQPYLVPIESVRRVLRVRPEDRATIGGRHFLREGAAAMPAARLDALLGLDTAPSGEAPIGLVLSAGEEEAALLVHELLGEREVLLKELRPPLGRVRYVSGAGRLGHGELALILRPADLLRGAQEVLSAPERPRGTAPAAPASILVVDDSITTRSMERNLLEAAGFQVQVAADGLEAWAALRAGAFDLVVSDVDMPRLNGFDLTARIRADARLAAVPVVLVTALESREDKERGIEVGANAYVIKSGFDQSHLLEIIQRLL